MSGFDGASINFILGTQMKTDFNKPVLTTEEIIKRHLNRNIVKS